VVGAREDDVQHALAVLRYKRIEIYDICNPLRHAVGDACNYHPAGTVSDENDLMKVFKFKDTRDVLDMSIKPDLAACQTRSLAESGERWREHLVPSPTQDRRDFFPAPTPIYAG
jgi:hypothetical protein